MAQKMAGQKGIEGFTSQIKVQARTTPRTKIKERTRKEKARKEFIPNLRLSASETPSEEGYGHAWESDDWTASHWLDDSLTSSAGWSCTQAHTAWMATTLPLNLANHPAHVVLDLGLYTVDWIKNGNRKIHEACMVL